MNPKIEWSFKKFEELTPAELYAALRLRSEVFVVEQNCVYLDTDNKDLKCYHLLGWVNDELVACSRIVPPGVSYPQPSIGRVVTSPAARKFGYGRQLMEKSIECTETLYGKQPIRIGAQYYLEKFYSSLGFKQSSDIYDEDGIPHIEMIREDEST